MGLHVSAYHIYIHTDLCICMCLSAYSLCFAYASLREWSVSLSLSLSLLVSLYVCAWQFQGAHLHPTSMSNAAFGSLWSPGRGLTSRRSMLGMSQSWPLCHCWFGVGVRGVGAPDLCALRGGQTGTHLTPNFICRVLEPTCSEAPCRLAELFLLLMINSPGCHDIPKSEEVW